MSSENKDWLLILLPSSSMYHITSDHVKNILGQLDQGKAAYLAVEDSFYRLPPQQLFLLKPFASEYSERSKKVKGVLAKLSKD